MLRDGEAVLGCRIATLNTALPAASPAPGTSMRTGIGAFGLTSPALPGPATVDRGGARKQPIPTGHGLPPSPNSALLVTIDR